MARKKPKNFNNKDEKSISFQDSHNFNFGFYEGFRKPPYKDYNTSSLYITMRDGVKLAIDVLLPEDLLSEEKIPAILYQTRYWRAAEPRAPFKWVLKHADHFPLFPLFKIAISYGYALIAVDVRGSGASFGSRLHDFTKDELQDTSEIIDWIIKQPWSNGKVGTIGNSYSGLAAEFSASTKHPGLKCAIPRSSEFDSFSDIGAPGGVRNDYFLKVQGQHNYDLDRNHIRFGTIRKLFFKGIKPVDSDKKKQLLKLALKDHKDNIYFYENIDNVVYRDDPLFGKANIFAKDFSIYSFIKEIEESNIPLNVWGSWLDGITSEGVINRFMSIKNPKRFVIGCWDHSGMLSCNPYLPPKSLPPLTIKAQIFEWIRYFDHYLYDIKNNNVNSVNILYYYTMGENKWKSTAIWPPENLKYERWYLSENNRLSKESPTLGGVADSYVVNFDTSTGKNNRWYTAVGGVPVIYPNRAKVDKKLLMYTSPLLEQDIEITGHPIITLYLTTTESDGVVFVYLEDISPEGNVFYITEGILRFFHRKISDNAPYRVFAPYHSYERKDSLPVNPGELLEIKLGLFPTSVLIKKGHSIRISIAGHDKDTFPRIPDKGFPVLCVQRNNTHASFIDFPIIKK